MGTIARVTLAEPRGEAFEAAFATLRRVDAAMSLYRPESGLVRVNLHAARHAEPVDAELFECLARARALSELTDGAFDVTVLPLLRRWGAYRELAHLPPGRVDAVGWGGLLLDAATRTVRFGREGMAVDLGGIAKGYALDRAGAALLDAGARRGVLDLGGNLLLLGAGPEDGWRIAVRDPARPEDGVGTLVLDRDLAVSTSGNYARDFAVEGWRTPSHVYDPRTGRPVAADLAVTVWAPDAATADAFSTALLVLGPRGAADVLARAPGVGALFVDDGGAARRITFAGAPPRGFEPPPAAAAPAVHSAGMENPQ
ncbi:MAG: FAD:protein FMN transferase [Deltaproteobacteria bacterium]|nr:FAD:protein FMN transferase [Deltaproteobacteria bacterium]